MVTPPARFVLRHLPLSARIAVSAFLLSVGLGYLAALVQLHYQHANKGELMPGPDDTVRMFHDGRYGRPDDRKKDQPITAGFVRDDGKSVKIASLLKTRCVVCHGEGGAWEETPLDKYELLKKYIPDPPAESKPPRPVGRMETLLTADRSLKIGAKGQMRTTFDTDSADWKESIEKRMQDKGLSKDEAVTSLMSEREGEFLAVLKWVQSGGPKKAYDDDTFPLPATPPAPPRQPQMGITKLAQTSHVHMLGFAMLYGLTGILLAFTTYPAVVRVFLCPLPLVVQAADIACWWLARMDAPYGVWAAKTIPVTGGIVAAGVMAHILLTLFDLYDGAGKVVLLLLLGGAGAGGFVCLKPVIEKELETEKPQPTEAEKKASPGRV